MKCAALNCNNEVSTNKKKYCDEHGYNGKCQIEGCNRRATKNYSLCSKHDVQWKNIIPTLKQKPTTYERFLKFIRIDKISNCWIWTGCTSNGYPFFYDGESPVHAFRYAYEISFGLTNKTVYHKCNNILCCNPEHLTIDYQQRGLIMADIKVFREIALPLVLRYEGGYSNNPADKGGPTNKGIIQVEYDRYRKEKGLAIQSVKFITDDEVQDIYLNKYWITGKCDQINSPKIAVVHFDSCVNTGLRQSAKFLQRAVKVNDDGVIGSQTISIVNKSDANLTVNSLINQRRDFYQFLVKRDSTQQVFLKGWLNRVNNLQTTVNTLC